MEKYDPKKIEEKWQEIWEKDSSLYAADEKSSKEKFYCLDMFPYPSGDGLHVGHVESYTATDIISRYQRMKGKNVLHPQGWDAFGLPAENYAIKTKTHPSITTKKAIENFKKQIKMLGFSYDWSREVSSSDPKYYKWTQWFFLLLYKNGLAYKKKAKVNWCPKCQTVLANEQAEGGTCERCETEVIQKDLEQWFFKITDFAEELLSGLDNLDWPESTKAAQKNWIGKSEGVEFEMKIKNSDEKIEVYTTRIDTVFGMTYAVVAPEHPIIEKLKDEIRNYEKVERYITSSKKKTELERTALQKEKTGVELEGIKLINPFTNEEISVFVADYVLGHYGTGAVMAVPAHDERDFDFSNRNNLDIKLVINPLSAESINVSNIYPNISPNLLKGENIEDATKRWKKQQFELLEKRERCFTDDGILINSEEYNGLSSGKAREQMTKWLEKEKIGKKKINYKLRDWLVSRQRYWGAPIPMIYCDKCGEIPDENLPVKLPTDVDFKPTGESPLKYSEEFQNVKCPKCGGKARRESDTMDTFVCSSWYYFRYSDPKNDKEFASKEQIRKWLPVDLYVGGAEHTVLHLLYARFFTKVLNKLGYINFDEPFKKLRHQGIILAEDGNKMSKSKGNVVNPDDVVKEYGADALRLFEMFMGPLEDAKPWNTKGIVGTERFLLKTVRVFLNDIENTINKDIIEDKEKITSGNVGFALNDGDDLIERQRKTAKNEVVYMEQLINKTIYKVSKDIDNLKFNTAISELMIFVNSISTFGINKNNFEKFLILLSPFAPHVAEELWEKLGHKESIFKEKWPEYDPALIKDEEMELVIQINGKLRDRIKVSADISEEEAIKFGKESEKVKNFIGDKEIKKVIFVKGKLINIVV